MFLSKILNYPKKNPLKKVVDKHFLENVIDQFINVSSKIKSVINPKTDKIIINTSNSINTSKIPLKGINADLVNVKLGELSSGEGIVSNVPALNSVEDSPKLPTIVYQKNYGISEFENSIMENAFNLIIDNFKDNGLSVESNVNYLNLKDETYSLYSKLDNYDLIDLVFTDSPKPVNQVLSKISGNPVEHPNLWIKSKDVDSWVGFGFTTSNEIKKWKVVTDENSVKLLKNVKTFKVFPGPLFNDNANAKPEPQYINLNQIKYIEGNPTYNNTNSYWKKSIKIKDLPYKIKFKLLMGASTALILSNPELGAKLYPSEYWNFVKDLTKDKPYIKYMGSEFISTNANSLNSSNMKAYKIETEFKKEYFKSAVLDVSKKDYNVNDHFSFDDV